MESYSTVQRFREFSHIVSKNNTKTCWVLKCDIKKFFHFIDQATLINILELYIPNQQIINLISSILESFPKVRKIGLPLGNLTSQLFCQENKSNIVENGIIAYNQIMEEPKTKLVKLREEQKRLRREITERTIGYLVAAFGVVAGLAWNDAVKSLISMIFPNPGNSVAAQFMYAIVVTIIIVIVTVYLVRLTQKDNSQK